MSAILASKAVVARSWQAVLAMVPWFCLAAVGSSGAATGQTGSAQTGIGQTGNSPADITSSQVKHVPIELIEPMLAELDTLFSAGDIKTYLSKFTPDHDGAIAMLGRHLERICAMTGAQRTRESKIIVGPMKFENRTVVRVRHVISWPASSGPTESSDPTGVQPSERRQHIEDTYLAVYRGDDGRIIPTFAIEMPPTTHCVKDAMFRCPPCNYEIGGIDGFLCVPLRREQGLALESASFYLIGTDVVCDVHVQVPNEPQSAKAVALTLAEAFAKIEPSAKVGIPATWVPPMHAAAPPIGMDSARLVVELPLDHPKAGGDLTIFHVVAFGGVQHVLLVRSSKESLHQHKASVDALFNSYMLLEVDCGDAELATRPLRLHTGGMLKGSTYHNEIYNVVLHGPKDWHAEHRVGGSAFRLRWSGPNGSQMWLIGYQVPAGMTAWTTATADRWLDYRCGKLELEADPEFASKDGSQQLQASWHEGPDGTFDRTQTLRRKQSQQPASPHRRILHVQLHDDLLLLVDGLVRTADDEAAVRAAIRSLKRK